MFNTTPVHYESYNKIVRIDRSDRIEVLLDLYTIDLEKKEYNKKRIVFVPSEQLSFLMALTGVTRYKLLGIDATFGLIWFEILNIGGYDYKNLDFQEKFKAEKLISLPDVFCLELVNLEIIKNVYDNLAEKHGYTTLEKLSKIKPDRKEILIQVYQEFGSDILKALCNFNHSKSFEKKTRQDFLTTITQLGLYSHDTNVF